MVAAQRPNYTFIFPVYNEEAILPKLFAELFPFIDSLDGQVEVIFIDDGSKDKTLEILHKKSSNDSRLKIISFSRNFGHQSAVSAGIEYSSGEAVIIMDADLQDPLSVAKEMIQKWKEGYQVVNGQRASREGERYFKKITAYFFYRFINKLSDIPLQKDVGDFRLVDRSVVEIFRQFKEHNRYIRGIFSWVGFKQFNLHYKRASRVAGSTKFPLSKMLSFAIDGIISFSAKPLRWVLKVGFLLSFVSLAIGLWAIFEKFFGIEIVTGWASLAALISFIGGIQLMVLGIIGEYIARIYDESRDRPRYIIKSRFGFENKNLLEKNEEAVLDNQNFVFTKETPYNLISNSEFI